ncbi:DMT family transporter [Paenibacillus urinalis]|uniref:DMT family transporter n=1 Tax=Paenibacillus urinalis TaxID=521520 RepID=UPI00195F5982
MDWVLLVLAGISEMIGVSTINKINKDRNAKSYIMFIFFFGLSFILLSIAMKTLPMGTAYAVWTGIGASGGAILGMILYGEPRNFLRILFIIMILGSAVGLKLVG